MCSTLKSIISIVVLLVAPFAVLSQVSATTSTPEILQRLDAGGNVTVTQPSAMSERLVRVEATEESSSSIEETTHQSSASTASVGYRIQVFSDANSTTAKSEAQTKERNIRAYFPTLSTYVSYKAPAWRLRVGDFINREEAEAMMRELKSAFPAYSRELIIVRDRINQKL